MPHWTPEDRDLGLDRPITRRDFLNAAMVGAGAALLHQSPPALRSPPQAGPWHPWTGYGGVGDYARSNGNTWEVIQAAHALRDGTYDRSPAGLVDTGEAFDLVICGGGFAGLGAAYFYRKAVGASPTYFDFDAFDEKQPRPQAEDDEVVVISADGKGVVMRPGDLRPATAEAAAKAQPKLKSRLSKGEKPNRKRMATVAAVYTVVIRVNTSNKVIWSNVNQIELWSNKNQT